VRRDLGDARLAAAEAVSDGAHEELGDDVLDVLVLDVCRPRELALDDVLRGRAGAEGGYALAVKE
jgi:hypothetical protein